MDWINNFPKCYIQLFHDQKVGGFAPCKRPHEFTEEELHKLNDEGYGIFCSPNGFTKGRRTEKDCDVITWWFADLEYFTKKQLQDRIKESPKTPTMIVETKNGYHLYWKIKGKSPNWHKVTSGIIEFFGSDSAISSLNEVLRIPGFNHMKGDPSPIKLIYQKDFEYSEEEMIKAFPFISSQEKIAQQLSGYEDDIDAIKSVDIEQVIEKIPQISLTKDKFIIENGKVTSAHYNKKENYVNRFSGKPGSGTSIDVVMGFLDLTTKEAIDWIRREFGIVRKKEEEKPIIGTEIFQSFSSVLTNVLENMAETPPSKVLSFGYDTLDKALYGILPGSLTIIGAEPGFGKSQFAGNLAMSTAKLGKKVTYFDLENDQGDLARRQIIRWLWDEYKIKVRIGDLYTNVLFEKYGAEIGKAIDHLSQKMGKNLIMFNNHKIPTIGDFVEYLGLVKDSDLIVVDHLHYFDFLTGKNETRADQLGQIMRYLRLACKERGIPVVLVSHLRKLSGGDPDKNDFYGSGDIAKECSSGIIFCKNNDENGYNTKIRVVKSRTDKEIDLYGNYDDNMRNFKEIVFDDNAGENIPTPSWK